MLKIGLTGGIACGKSFVGHLFKVYGVTIIEADVVAREVVEPNMPALQQIVKCFGAEILDESGALKRRSLRKIVFSSQDALQQLNEITHPAIHQRLAELIELVGSGKPLPESYLKCVRPANLTPDVKEAFTVPLDTSLVFTQGQVPPYLILDIPLLFENKLTNFVDKVLVVDIPPQMQLKQIMERDNVDAEAAKKIIDAQISRDERLKHADEILDFEGADIEKKRLDVLNLHKKFISLACGNQA